MVTLALAYDIDAIADRAKLHPAGLAEAAAAQQLPLHVDHRVPGPQGQPEGHQGLGRPGEGRACASSRRTPRPPAARAGTTWPPGAMRCEQPGDNEAKAREFVAELFKNVPVLDSGARGSTDHVRAARHRRRAGGLGERGACWRVKELGPDKFEIVVPSLQHPGRAAGGRGGQDGRQARNTRRSAQAYLEFLYSPEGQEIAAKHYYRPRPTRPWPQSTRSSFPKLKLFTIDEVFGGWAQGADRALRRRRRVRPDLHSRTVTELMRAAAGDGARIAAFSRFSATPAYCPASA